MNSLKKALNRISEQAEEWLDQGIENLPNFLVALILFVGFLILSRVLGRILKKRISLVSKNEGINGLVVSVFKIGIMLFGIITCLSVLHLDRTIASILAGVGLLGLAFSFAFQHTAHNLLSGLVIASKSSIDIGHFIECNGVQGVVERIGLRSTYLDNLQGQIVAVPNRLITDDNYMDYSVLGEMRIDIVGGVAYDSDLTRTKQTAVSAIQDLNLMKEGRDIEFYFTEMADFSIQFELRFWIHFNNRPVEMLEAKHQAIVSVMEGFREAGVEIPFPVTTVRGSISTSQS